MGDDDYQTMTNLSLTKYTFDHPEFDEISSTAKDFVAQLLIKDPTKRMRARNALNHEWLTQLDSIKNSPDICLSMTKRKLKRYVILRRYTTFLIKFSLILVKSQHIFYLFIRWRKAALSVMFINKLNKTSNSHLLEAIQNST